MQIRLSPPRLRFPLHRRRFLFAFVFAAVLAAAGHALFRFHAGSVALFLPLVLLGALGVGREFLSPSLKELAFYCFAVIAAVLIWPGAHLAVSAYDGMGFVTLAAFMAFVFALAVALGVLAVKLLAGQDDEK